MYNIFQNVKLILVTWLCEIGKISIETWHSELYVHSQKKINPKENAEHHSLTDDLIDESGSSGVLVELINCGDRNDL